MKKLYLPIIFILLLMSCSKELVEPIKPTKSDVTINFTSKNALLFNQYKVVLINEKNDSIVINNTNTLTSIPFGKYKIYGYSIPKRMTWENREQLKVNNHYVSSWVTDTIHCEINTEQSYPFLNQSITSNEIRYTYRTDGNVHVASLSTMYTDCSGSKISINLFVYHEYTNTGTLRSGLPFVQTVAEGVNYVPLCN